MRSESESDLSRAFGRNCGDVRQLDAQSEGQVSEVSLVPAERITLYPRKALILV